MAGAVCSFCENYFSGYSDLDTFHENDSFKNFLGVIKVISYGTLVLPLFFGVLYAVSSLIGRVSVSDNLSPEDERVSEVSQRRFPRTVEQQLDDFFTATSKAQRIFNVDDARVGIIYNPEGESLRIGLFTVTDQVVLISERAIPEAVANRIAARIPSHLSYSTLCFGSINGSPTFSYLGFEEEG